MEKVITVVKSFEDADRADKEYYLSLSPLERLGILLELNRRWPLKDDADTTARPARVYRATERA